MSPEDYASRKRKHDGTNEDENVVSKRLVYVSSETVPV